ncbi:MAG TPA: hypothetical protein VM260_11550, partial [Pirellula sp.]|nr:hypothetical protein [Pirellula sp.]
NSGWRMLAFTIAGIVVTLGIFIAVISLRSPLLLLIALPLGSGCFISLFDIQSRLDKAGVRVIEARISHLAYAPEIASAMLQRQQAHAVVAARTKIVDGAVGMVQMALERLTKDKIVDLDDERRAAMVSNLLVVLCSDRHAQPVINTGSLYS